MSVTTKNVTAVAGSAPAYSAQRAVVVKSAYAAGRERVSQHVTGSAVPPAIREACRRGREGGNGGSTTMHDVV